MRKMKTLFKREFTNKREVIIHNQVTEGCEWVLKGEGVATLKIDGTACLVKDGRLYVRFDTWMGNKGVSKKKLKAGKPFREEPIGSIWCQDMSDPITGSFPVWAPIESVDTKSTFKPYLMAWMRIGSTLADGTYELCGPSIQGNPEKLEFDTFIKHGSIVLNNVPRDFNGLHEYLTLNNIEGIVFHRGNGEMAKIKRTDFGLDWGHSLARKRK